MAWDLHGSTMEKAEMLSGRLKELLSAGQDFVRAQLGLDFGLEPELYPTWLLLSGAALLLLLPLLSWAAGCGRWLPGKLRRLPVTTGSGEPVRSGSPKPEEQQRRRNRKKAADKAPQAAAATSGRVTKTQSNGQPGAGAEEEGKVSKLQIKSEKAREAEPPVQVKKNKKKTKSDVKPVQRASTHDAKDADDGAWETKVSNRESRERRRKDKSSEDPGGSGGVDAPRSHGLGTNAKKTRGCQVLLSLRTSGKAEKTSGAVKAPSSRGEEPTGNAGGWSVVPPKVPADVSKWCNVSSAPEYRAPAEPQCWTQDTPPAWSGVQTRMKADIDPAFFLRRQITSEPTSAGLQWASSQEVNDEWSGFDASAAADPTSDWNAPAEYWGNYEEPPAMETPAPPLKEQQPVHNKVSEDEKDAEDCAAKSKKNRKKKKKTQEEEKEEEEARASTGFSKV